MKQKNAYLCQPFKNRALLSFLCLLVAFSISACSDSTSTDEDDENNPPPATADIQITVDNVGASAWEVTGMEGDENAAEENEENTAITLEVGQRYRLVNNGGSAHPFGLQNANGDYLLAQGSESGSFESDGDTDFESDEEGITFTLTQALADELSTYNCQIHGAMVGSITIR
jgi:FtsP/CotA-like multicopper oxidase with cupredoxin domain